VTDPDDTELRCRECGGTASLDGPQYCDRCFGPLEVVLVPPIGSPVEVRAAITAGPPSIARCAPLLPWGLDLGAATSGWTPLRPAPVLGEAIGHDALWIKDETANPTGSFKDRVVDVALARARAIGAPVAACSSTGNLARAVAAGACAAEMPAVVLVPEALDPRQVDDLTALGAHVVAVRGPYDAASRLGADAAADLARWAWVNVTLRPWYELGARTLAWEIAEQMGWSLPDRVVTPMASGALARALYDGFGHLVEHGLVRGPLPALTVVEPGGCPPVADAFAAGLDRARPVRPDTIAQSLAMGDPPDGDAVIAAARATGGAVISTPEEEILPAVDLLHATEGIAAEPAGGVVVAAVAGLVTEGAIRVDERVVVVVTGAAHGRRPPGLVPPPGATYTIEPSVGALLAALPPEITRT
jgi:threonine synthase